MTEQEKILDYREYTSLILSCQLAAEFNKDKPNKAIKACAKRVKQRIESQRVKQVCDNAIKSHFALGWLTSQTNRINRDGQDAETFFSIGATV